MCVCKQFLLLVKNTESNELLSQMLLELYMLVSFIKATIDPAAYYIL